MRCFVALGLNPAPGAALATELEGLRAGFRELAVPPPQNLHLTLAFLGEIDGPATAQAAAAVAECARAAGGGFSIAWGGAGAFPTLRRPRVVWLGVADESRTAALHRRLTGILLERGFEVEDRVFRPHLTLARVRGALTPARIEALSDALSRVRLPPASDVQALVLYSSRLGSGSPVYQELASAPL